MDKENIYKMRKIWEFFENLNEYVYVTEIESRELLYMNKKARETYGFSSMDEVVGKKCYEVLHGCSSPCAFCNNHELKEHDFCEWSFYNPLLNKHLALKDTMVVDEGRRCRFEIAVDISVQEMQSNALRSYEDLETIANEGFRLALQASTPDKSVDVILEYLGKALKGDRTYVFEQNEQGRDDNTYEWVANGVNPEIDNLQNLPAEVCANWYQNFRENKNILIEDLEDIREEDPMQYDNLKRQDIHSLVVVPLYDGKKIIGFYGVDNPTGKSLDYAQNILQIVGHFIISCLKRRNLLKQLEKMSYSDQLTGFGNRFAMDQYVANMQPSESIGVVYCDITGLKNINDTKGHKEGDKLIIRSCACLRKVFGNEGIFRIGGDELLVLCSEISKDYLINKIELLKQEMSENSVVMAVGYAWREDGRIDFDRILAEAEQRMYEDKEAYYRNSGIERRKH